MSKELKVVNKILKLVSISFFAPCFFVPGAIYSYVHIYYFERTFDPKFPPHIAFEMAITILKVELCFGLFLNLLTFLAGRKLVMRESFRLLALLYALIGFTTFLVEVTLGIWAIVFAFGSGLISMAILGARSRSWANKNLIEPAQSAST